MLPGMRGAVFGLFWALPALTGGTWLGHRLLIALRRGVAPDEPAWLSLFTAAILVCVCMAFMPAYDYQRTYRPFVKLARAHRDAGYNLAMAGWDERNLGAMMFYLDSRLTVLPEDPMAWRAFITAYQPAAVILTERQLSSAPKDFFDSTISVTASRHQGYKSREFRLLTSIRPAQAEAMPGEIHCQ